MTPKERIGWSLAVAGAVFGILAAIVKGGLFEALTAASVACTGLASVWGIVNKAPSAPATQAGK